MIIAMERMREPAARSARLRGAVLTLVAVLLVVPCVATAQTDVELVGRMLGGTRPPPGYYEMLRRDPQAFQFSRDNGWIRRASAVARRRAERRAAALRARSATGVSGRFTPRVALAAWGMDGALEGDLDVPVFLILYANTAAAPFPRADMEQRLYGTSPAPPYSVYTYYQEISNGKLFVNGTVLDWTAVPEDDTVYEGGPDCNGLCWPGSGVPQLIEDIVAAHDAAVDFRQFDNDGPDGVPNSDDDDGVVDAIVLIHPEVDGACGDQNPGAADNIWAHSYSYAAWTGGTMLETNDDVNGGGAKIKVNDYIIQGGQGGDDGCVDNEPLAMGLIAHETGHLFDLPDLYNVNWDTRTSEGIGHWGLMGSGNWNTPDAPAHLMAWSRARLGWITEVLIDSDQVLDIEPIATSHTAYIVPIPGSDEYYLLENRQRIGSDLKLHAPGLLIWHVDSALARLRSPPFGNSVNGTDPEAVRLIQADGSNDLWRGTDGGGNRGDAGDPFPGSTFNTRFGYDTDPAAARNDGAPVEVSIAAIEQLVPGGAVRVQVDFSVPPLAATGPGTLPAAIMGSLYSYQFGATGGVGVYDWTLVGGALPEGLTLFGSGLLSGRPAESGTFGFTVRVTSGSQLQEQAVTLEITEPVLQTEDILAQLFQAGTPLSADELAYLDLLGNRNGGLDVGDFLAWVDSGAPAMTAAQLAAALRRAREGSP